MRGIILKAGRGDRLRPITGNRPKRVARVGGCPILERQVRALDRLVAASAIKDWAPTALAGFCRRRPLHVVDHRGFPWIEIDSPNDYWRARTHIAPVDDAAPIAGTAVRRAADHV